jgi:antitoxin component of MazEF toxin-antitoxin module
VKTREQKIIKHGGSAGITIDKVFLNENGLRIGDIVQAVYGRFGNVLVIAMNVRGEANGIDQGQNSNRKPCC